MTVSCMTVRHFTWRVWGKLLDVSAVAATSNLHWFLDKEIQVDRHIMEGIAPAIYSAAGAGRPCQHKVSPGPCLNALNNRNAVAAVENHLNGIKIASNQLVALIAGATVGIIQGAMHGAAVLLGRDHVRYFTTIRSQSVKICLESRHCASVPSVDLLRHQNGTHVSLSILSRWPLPAFAGSYSTITLDYP